jgi:hypothetical protein
MLSRAITCFGLASGCQSYAPGSVDIPDAIQSLLPMLRGNGDDRRGHHRDQKAFDMIDKAAIPRTG